MKSGAKEDPADRAARLRDRRLSLLERRQSAEETADSLTTDLRSVYGLGAMSMFGRSGSFRGGSTPTGMTGNTAALRAKRQGLTYENNVADRTYIGTNKQGTRVYAK